MASASWTKTRISSAMRAADYRSGRSQYEKAVQEFERQRDAVTAQFDAAQQQLDSQRAEVQAGIDQIEASGVPAQYAQLEAAETQVTSGIEEPSRASAARRRRSFRQRSMRRAPRFPPADECDFHSAVGAATLQSTRFRRRFRRSMAIFQPGTGRSRRSTRAMKHRRLRSRI